MNEQEQSFGESHEVIQVDDVHLDDGFDASELETVDLSNPDPVLKDSVETTQHQERLKQFQEKVFSDAKPEVAAKQIKVTVSVSPFREATDEEKEQAVIHERVITLPADVPSVIIERLNDKPNVDMTSTTEGRQFLKAIERGQDLLPSMGSYIDTVSDESREWGQKVDGENGEIRLKRPQIDKLPSHKLVGEEAMIRVQALTRRGGLITVPLWHSGFWVTLKTPSDAELVNLEYNLSNDKVVLGRLTSGAIFNNDSVYISEHLFRLFESHIYSTTLEDSSNLASKIKVQDMQLISWALACAIWPRGYLYSRPIFSAKEEDQDRIVTGMVDLARLMWVDRSSLSDTQVKMMSRSTGQHVTQDQLTLYQDSFQRKMSTKILLDDNGETKLSVILKVPSLAEHFSSGHEWVQRSVQSVEATLAMDADNRTRESMMIKHASARLIGKYGHYVSAVLLEQDGEEVVIDDRETIDLMLETWSADEVIRDVLLTGILKFIDDSAVAIIATPTLDNEETPVEQWPRLIPMDSTMVFFIPLVQKLKPLA